MAAHGMFGKAIAGTARAYARQDCVVSTRRDYRPLDQHRLLRHRRAPSQPTVRQLSISWRNSGRPGQE